MNSAVTRRITQYWYKDLDASFLTPRSLFEPCDAPLLKAGVFRVARKELDHIACPFGCGDIEPIIRVPRENQDDERVVVCRRGEGEALLKPEDYQLMEFDPDAYEHHCCGKPLQSTSGRMYKRRRARRSKWMQIELTAVSEYANDPKRNKTGKKASACVDIVWRLNKDDFEAALQLPKGKCGYKKESLRQHFLRLEAKAELKRYAPKVF